MRFSLTKRSALAYLSVALVATLLSQEAMAKKTITFKYMVVHDDEEGGDGDWNVTADMSPGQKGMPLIQNEEAGTGETITINRDSTFPEFPVTVTLKVEEHDGGIGATWEHVGTKTVTIHGPGNYYIRAKNNEGDVSIYFDVTNIGTADSPLTGSGKIPGKLKKYPKLHKVNSSLLKSGEKFSVVASGFGSDWKKVGIEFRQNGKYVTAAVAKSAFKFAKAKNSMLTFETPNKLKTGNYTVRLFVWSPLYGPSNQKLVRVQQSLIAIQKPSNNLTPKRPLLRARRR